MIILTKLLLAHILGDFFLQPKHWVKDKEKRKLKSLKLYAHIALHLLVMFLIIWDLSHWPLIIAIGVSHFIIDAAKLLIQKKKTKRIIFFIDQIFHLASITIAYYVFTNARFQINDFITNDNLLLITFLLFLTTPASIVMKTIFTKWNIDSLTKGNESLKDAGKYIGILERLLVFIFIVVGHWEAVGFLITAKSVFRFGDLKESKHRKLTEYILIGTLISFGIAITTAILYNQLIS